MHMAGTARTKLRSQQWFDNPDNPGMTALYIERYLNYGLTREELQSGKPMIGIAQTGSDLSPCNRHHIELAKRVRDGITAAGGSPSSSLFIRSRRQASAPTASLDRNLAYLGLVEVLYGYPLDGVVLTIGCDKTTPALLMGLPPSTSRRSRFRSARCSTAGIAASAPAPAPSSGRRARCCPPARSTTSGFMDLVASSAPSVGYCNTMGTATTMNSLAEALGMQLPGSAAIPAPYRERGQIAYETGRACCGDGS
jgi:dihydroxy-acid dehydratase